MVQKKQIVIVCLSLTIVTFIAFWRVTQCEFTNYDDPSYVTNNNHVLSGITMEGIVWAFSTGHASNWHPLTWISHMLDVQLFGLDPHRHHLVNLLFHIATTVMLFLVLHHMTDALWKCAFVAALFALHPLHVESVAWVAERKDVLSAFFWMLTMGAYISYVRRPGLPRRLVVLLCFALGLMSKPMLVTFPFVLLLLDYWPLKRFVQPNLGDKKRKPSKHTVTGQWAHHRWAMIRPLLLEKIPFFVLTALSSVITYIVQQKGGALAPLEAYPITERLGNAFVSYVTYVGKMLWPTQLAVLYPHPGSWPFWEVLGAVLLLSALTSTILWRAQRFHYLAVGWLWYVVTLVPVVGIVQVGAQASADRYTYIPLIGLFIMAAWGIPELVKKWRYRKEALGTASALSLACLLVATWPQVGYWQTSMSLYDHTLKVTNRNSIIHNNRGFVYNGLGKFEMAIADFDRALEINPRYAEAYYNRGFAYNGLGNFERAIMEFDRALEINPRYADAYVIRGDAYNRLGNYKQAIEDLDKAVEINPNYAEAYYNRGNAYNGLGKFEMAIVDFDMAIQINPRYADAYINRGVAYNGLGNYRQAIESHDRAIEINPRHADAYIDRGIAYGRLDNFKQAIDDFDRAIEINPRNAEAYINRGVNYSHLGNHKQAIAEFDRAIEINPSYAEAFYYRGFACNGLGNYKQAIESYDKAIELNPEYAEAYCDRGIAYGRLGNDRQAIEDLKTAARLGYQDAKNVLKNLGITK
jgi:protein O-mannosyl-transferase